LWPAAAGNLLWMLSEAFFSINSISATMDVPLIPLIITYISLAVYIVFRAEYRRIYKYKNAFYFILDLAHPVLIILFIHALRYNSDDAVWILIIIYVLAILGHICKASDWRLTVANGIGLFTLFIYFCSDCPSRYYFIPISISVTLIIWFWGKLKEILSDGVA
jgi:hypothetical protein